jgi:ribonucleoside-diphosphate reductase alpha chain
MAKSLVDYIFRWLALTFPGGKAEVAAPAAQPAVRVHEQETAKKEDRKTIQAGAPEPQRVDTQFKDYMQDAPACDVCGSITVRNGACYRCYNCGNSMGCS